MRALHWAPTVLVVGAFTLTFAGSATATALLTGRQVLDESITGRDLANGSVAHADIKPAGLGRGDIHPDALPAAGPPGPVGTAGGPGPAGAQGVSDVRMSASSAVRVGPGQFAEIPINCSGRHRVAHGGVSTSSPGSGLRIQESAPSSGHTGWQIRVVNDGTDATTARAWALCIDAG